MPGTQVSWSTTYTRAPVERTASVVLIFFQGATSAVSAALLTSLFFSSNGLKHNRSSHSLFGRVSAGALLDRRLNTSGPRSQRDVQAGPSPAGLRQRQPLVRRSQPRASAKQMLNRQPLRIRSKSTERLAAEVQRLPSVPPGAPRTSTGQPPPTSAAPESPPASSPTDSCKRPRSSRNLRADVS